MPDSEKHARARLGEIKSRLISELSYTFVRDLSEAQCKEIEDAILALMKVLPGAKIPNIEEIERGISKSMKQVKTFNEARNETQFSDAELARISEQKRKEFSNRR